MLLQQLVQAGFHLWRSLIAFFRPESTGFCNHFRKISGGIARGGKGYPRLSHLNRNGIILMSGELLFRNKGEAVSVCQFIQGKANHVQVRLDGALLPKRCFRGHVQRRSANGL